jgi:flagellar biosynthesis/type III secretory pathway protein FliH
MTLQIHYQEKFKQGLEQGREQGLEQGLEQGQNLLADAIKKIKANNCLTAKDLVEAGFSKEAKQYHRKKLFLP